MCCREAGRDSLAKHIENFTALVEELDLRDITLVMQDWGVRDLGPARHARRKYRERIDTVHGFTSDECTLGEPASWRKRATVYAAYRSWCEGSGRRALRKQTFLRPRAPPPRGEREPSSSACLPSVTPKSSGENCMRAHMLAQGACYLTSRTASP